MGFNERTHAFISAKFHTYLSKEFGERGVKAFIHATQYYAGQRGRRMAQRAIRDGHELDFDTYLRYGEWMSTEDIKNAGDINDVVLKSLSPDYVMHIFRCPWHLQFEEMGLKEAGHEYCEHLDNSLCRGFNPYIPFSVEQTLHKSDSCIHRAAGANLKEDTDRQKKVEYIRDFEYHCAHVYWSFNEVTEAIFGEKGAQVNSQVLGDFADVYGQDMADTLTKYKHTNFNVI